MEKFIGRKKELELLQEVIKRDKSTISVIYGRRRVGKSELFRHAFKDIPVLYFEGLENQAKSKQILNFVSQLTYQVRPLDFKDSSFKNWSEALKLLIPLVRDKKIVIVFDELQ